MSLPSDINPQLLALSSGYNLTRSLRFRSSASATLSRTFGTPTNNKIWTQSLWVKRGSLAATRQTLLASTPGGVYWILEFDASNRLNIYDSNASSPFILTTTQVFVDPSAWYHIVVAEDTTQATASNRTKVYVNGSQITSFSQTNYAAQNSNPWWNAATYSQSIASALPGGGLYFDGYIAELNFIDGQALTPSSFGSYNSVSGVWQPAPYTGTYGTNGFYLPFTDNSALTTSSNVGLGKDFSGNGNYWTTNNISITAGVTYDSMTDVPTLTSATAANFAVLNPLNAETGMTGTLAGGNLNLSGSGGKRSTIAARSGKWYWEFVSNSGAASNFPISGIYVAGLGTYYPGYDGNSFGYFQGGGIYYNGSTSLTVSSYTDGDIIGFAWDADTGKVYVSKNNTWQNSGNPAAGTGQVATISTGVDRVVGAYLSSGSCSINFGQRPFTYTAPSGFVALNTYNLPTSTIVKGNTVMDATLYTGTGASLSVTNTASFKPDLVWVKGRSGATDHAWYDSVRGTTKQIESNNTDAETTEATGLTAFGSAGFTVGALAQMNTSAATYVGWQWQAGQGTTSSNTNGTITSTVSVNASAGFSVVTYTGTGANATVGHGLGVAPNLVIVKQRSAAGENWQIYSSALADATYRIRLNTTDGQDVQTTMWNSTAPTSSVFSIGTASGVNTSAATYVAYCWSQISGFSSIGRYTGNGSADGPFVYTGFRPKFVLIKRIDSAGNNWRIWDTARATYNAGLLALFPNVSDAEDSVTDTYDLVSNGFKLRTSGTGLNASGGTYIYMCFAENPLKNALAR